jgi:hypothetical protein
MKTSSSTQSMPPDVKKDIFTVLAIAALLHGTSRAVQQTAKKLAETAPRAFCRNTLLPLSKAADAYDIIMELAVFPVEEHLMGIAHIGESEYDVVLKITDHTLYNNETAVTMMAGEFLRKGIIQGRLYFDLTHPFLRRRFKSSIDMARFANEAAFGVAA